MSNFGDQARLPTDRPPDSNMSIDRFPKTKTILWDKTGTGKSTFLHLGYFRKPRVCIPEKILKLVQHQCENYGQKDHTLIGTLIVEDDGEAVQFQVDRLDTRPIVSADVSANLAPGDLLIPLEVTNNAAGKRRGSVDDFVIAIKRLQERCCSKSSIDLSNFVLLRGWVSFFSNAHSSVAHMDFDMVTMGTVFKATPIANVPIVLTALSKNLAGPMSLSHTQGTSKSGYLTMDHTRKLLLVLESDPKAGSLPIVGIWISGVEFIQHSFVWAACLRYIHNTHLQDRVCAPPEDFLLVLYSPLHSRPEFYQCSTTTGESKLMYELFSGHEVCNHTKSLSSQSDDFTEVELSSENSGEKKALFDAALAKHSTRLCDDHSEKRWTDDINPRSIPTPHTEMLPVIKPMVPDVSILWTDSPNNSALPFQPPSHAPSAPLPSVSIGNQTVFSTANNNKPPQHLMSNNARLISPSGLAQVQLQSYVPSVSYHHSSPHSISTSRDRGPVSQPHVSPVHHQQFHSSFQNSSPSSFNVSKSSVMSMNSGQNNSHNPYSVNGNVPHSNNNTYTSPIFHTQNQAVSHTLSLNPHTLCNNNNQVSHQSTHSATNTVYTPPYVGFNGNNPHSGMVLSTPGQNTHLTSQSTMATPNQNPAVPTYRLSLNQPLPSSTQVPIVSGSGVLNSTPHWQNNHLSGRSSTRSANDGMSSGIQAGPSNDNSSNPNNNYNAPHTPLSRNHFPSVNTLKTVVEETSSNSSSSSSTATCSGCKCHSDKNRSGSNASNIPRQLGGDANYSVVNNSTKSSDDDSGLSVTPERPSSSPPPPPPQACALESSVVSGNTTTSQEVCTSAFGDAMNNVNWNQVPPEIRCLLIQQNEQLKLLQQQIQMLMLNQSSQSQKCLSTAGNDIATSNPSLPPLLLSASSDSKELCSIAVNTSFVGDNHHQTMAGSQPVESSAAKVHSSRVSLSSDLPQSQEGFMGQTSHNSSIPFQTASCNDALEETNISSVSNRISSSSKSLSPRAQNEFDRGVIEGNSSVSSDHSGNFRTSVNPAEVSEMDSNRSQIDPSFPNDSDFYNCQDESYSTVAEDAADPRQFYDQIMNNINMFLTNGEDNNNDQTEENPLSSTLHDSTTKFPESANSSLFPHINYMSMMLGGSSDTGQSMEINAMAMKYLKDDQLTQMAMMLKQNGGSEEHTTNKLIQRMISSGSGNSNKKSSFDVSHVGISPNNLTMGTRNYLEKHGLLGNDSQCFNDYSAFDHTFKLKTDFSVAMTDRDDDKSSGNIRSWNSSPVKNYGRSQTAVSPRVTEPEIGAEGETRQNFNYKQNNYPKDLGASPVLLPPKHYNKTQSPVQRAFDRIPSKERNDSFDDDNADNENILDIAKLKRLPKLL